MSISRRNAPRPTDVSILLERFFKGSALGPKMDFFTLSEQFESILGEGLAKRVKLIDLKDSVLVLKASNAAWKNELEYQKKAIIDRCNALLDKAAVKSVRFI